MTETKKEKVTQYSVFVAVDGTEFLDKEECKKYEDTANCVLLTRVKSMAITEIMGGEEDFMDENDENQYVTIIPKTQADIDTINQFLLLSQPNRKNLLNDNDIDRAILIGCRVYSNKLDWSWYYRVDNIIKKILPEC